MGFRRRIKKDGSIDDIGESGSRHRATPRRTARQRLQASPLGRLKFLALSTLKSFFRDSVPRLGAALAYYTTIAVAPLLVIAIAVAGIFFDEGTARERVLGEIENLAGSKVTEAISQVEDPRRNTGNLWATVIGSVTLAFGAFGVFMQLQNALNSIWRVEDRAGESWLGMVKRRLFSMATVMAVGFLLIVSLVVSAALSWMGQYTGTLLGVPEALLQWVNYAISFAALTLAFAVIFKILPDAEIRWRNVWLGGAVTALLFTVGKAALAFYFAKAKVGAAYGVASSAIALLIWTYYAAQILFLGAEFTRIHTLTRGGRDREALATEKPRTHSAQYDSRAAQASPRVADKTAR